MGRCLLALLLFLPAVVPGQDWSGASLRSAPAVELPPGYRLEVLGVGFQLPQDLAFDPPDGLWVLSQAERGGGAGALTRVPLTGSTPIDAATLPAISIPFVSERARFRVGSVARDPTTGDLYVAEGLGRHLVRVSPHGPPAAPRDAPKAAGGNPVAGGRPGNPVVLYARGLNLLSDSRSLAFDAEGRLVVLDFTGRSAVADADVGGLRELFGESDRYVGPVVYRLRVDEALRLPRNLEYATPSFPPSALRRQGARLPRYVGVLALPTGDLILSGSAGEIDRLRRDGTITPVARVSAARVVAAGRDGDLYAVDFLGGRIVRVGRDGTVHRFVEGLVRPAAVTILPDGTVLVAEDTNRLLRLRPSPGG
ncbi:MAG: hypothetical protein HY002_20085 [Candidatus Rokubacteria bacterium]|nr:hypothetical protein [Candidatus Rokubacteria bacterium]